MDKFKINGPSKIRGEVSISGSKNAALPILAATLLFDKNVTIKNLPRVKDIDTMLNLLKSLGRKISFKNNKKIATISKGKKNNFFAPYSLVKTMRAGILVLGPLLAKNKKAKVSSPGGCSIGVRPIDIHLKAISKLGVKIQIEKGYVNAKAQEELVGSEIRFSKISVGATENLILAACLAKGITTIKNCAIEPEIKDLTNFLKTAGAKIKWIGKRTLKIEGVKTLKSITYSIMNDRIEAGTFCVAACLNGGNLKIKNFEPKIINTEINLLKKIGARIKTTKNTIQIKGPKKIKSLDFLKTGEYPNFPTDLQAQIMVLLTKANGKSTIEENIFENRFMHVPELKRLGAKINIKGNKAIIEGTNNLEGAELMSSDLRASVALVLAAFISRGTSIINRVYHLDRGYEKIENKLKKIGVKIKRIS